MTKKIFYEKVGRRYKPVSEYDSEFLDSFRKGTHLIMCYPGGQSTRFNIDPAFAPMIAAGRFAERAIAEKIVEASSMRPSSAPLTEEQHTAWQNLCTAFGKDLYSLQWDSAHGIAQAGVEAMQEEADKLMQHPGVRQAFEHFMLLCKLATQEVK